MSSPFKIRPASWARVSALFDEIIDSDAQLRAAILSELRRDDPETAAELEQLLRSAAQPETMGPATRDTPFTVLLSAALADDAQRRHAGQRFGAWTLAEHIGRGGMGEVWRATRSDGLFEGQAAIKLLRSDLSAEKLAARFSRERSLLARLNHPNIARMLDAGVDDDQAFLVLELVDGKPLLEHVEAHAPSVAERVKIIRDIARAVEHAHAQLVLHRDLKPSNVLVTQDGGVKLLDFGVAAVIDDAEQGDHGSKLTQLTGRGLTIEYAAPEQITGEPSVAASDVYSLGVMLFHLCTGERPFADRKGRSAIEYAVVHAEAARASSALAPRSSQVLPPPLGVEGWGEGPATSNPIPHAATLSLTHPHTGRGQTKPDQIAPPLDPQKIKGDLDAIIAKTLRKSPAERYLTASAFASDLEAWLTQTPISIRAEDRSYRSKLWFKRNWKLATLSAIAAAAVMAGFGVSLWQRSIAVANEAIAKDEAARTTKVADYLGELIQSASPDNHGGKWPTVLALLEQSEKDLEQKFKDDPRTYAKLLKQMLDTNDALNRDSVALSQAQRLDTVLATLNPPELEVRIDTRQQQGWLLRRLLRNEEALAMDEQTLPMFAAHYGKESIEYAKLVLGRADSLRGLNRFDEASAAFDQGYAILSRLKPNDITFLLNAANDKTVLLSNQGRWNEAADALSAMEGTFETVAAKGGAQLRDVLGMRNNLETIRIRLGHYDGTEARLQAIAEAGNRLLGSDNVITLRSNALLAVSACETGAYAQCLQRHQSRLESVKKRVGIEPSELVEAELDALSAALLIQQAPLPASRESLHRLTLAIATALPTPSAPRSFLYRIATDAAIRADDLALARRAVANARADLIAANVSDPERIAQVDRAAAAIAFRSGDPVLAASLLNARFRNDAKAEETDTPRHATLWLQRALYEIEFDPVAADKSLAESRSTFARAGGAMPQFKALIAYIDARISKNATSVLEAQEAVDRAYLRSPTRKGQPLWRAPHLSSL
jgi:eukaryotic-like serine/threonine-protein kinase